MAPNTDSPDKPAETTHFGYKDVPIDDKADLYLTVVTDVVTTVWKAIGDVPPVLTADEYWREMRNLFLRTARLSLAELLRSGTTLIQDMGTVHHQDTIFEVLRPLSRIVTKS